MLKFILSLFGDRVIPVIFELLGDFALQSIKDPTSKRALTLYTYLKPFDTEVINPVLAKIEENNVPSSLVWK